MHQKTISYFFILVSLLIHSALGQDYIISRDVRDSADCIKECIATKGVFCRNEQDISQGECCSPNDRNCQRQIPNAICSN